MKARKRRATVPLPFLMAELMVSSWETIGHRTWMIARGSCSAAEYQRMVWEKAQAAQHSGLALALLFSGGGMATVLDPWHSRATANARRLRKKR